MSRAKAPGPLELAPRILKGDVRAASRLMRDVDDGLPSAVAELRALFPHTGRATVVGLTGSPGAGKSSLVDRLVALYRQAGKQVGVVAVDPTSPFSGGAILGDRIRMQSHATDGGVFIRSLATRGHLGGLSRAAADCVRIMDAMGKELVLVETVGVGQDEIDVAGLAHCVVVVVVPGMGDDIQAIKAGILEVADVFAVNKADREGADRTVRELHAMLELRHATLPPAAPGAPELWEPPIVETVATASNGVADLAAAIASQLDFLERTGQRAAREVQRARVEFLAILRDRLLASALARLEAERGRLDEVASRIAAHQADPWALAEELAG
ncbi:MAG: methylmalonyl Co-A mutase-associated GTPase MeaB [Myxococcales bacterium]